MKNYITFVIAIIGLSLFDVSGQQTRKLEREKSTVQSEKRTALVIGNGNYADAPLRNPPNDAADMAAALKSLGFEVLSYTDLDQTAMKRAIREFGARLKSAGGVGLFYYAGHGVQSMGVNYLIPVRATVDSEQEVEYEAIEAGFILAQMEAAGNPMNIVILDACRNNPFTRSYRSSEKGLAQMRAPTGSLIAYSTAPGSVALDGTGRNGAYTKELLENMRKPNVSIENVFKSVRIGVRESTGGKQTPWESSSLTGEFYFSGTGLPNDRADTNKSPDRASASNGVEDEYWNNIKGKDDPKLFESYLREFPSGRYAALARQRISNYQARDETGTSVDQYLTRGTAAFGKGKHDEALAEIDKAISMGPENSRAYFVRGNVFLFGKKLYTRATAEFDRCIALDPNYFGCYNGRGVALHEMKDYSKAIAAFSEAIRLSPSWEPAYTFRANSYEKLGDKASAAADRAKARDIASGRAGVVPETTVPKVLPVTQLIERRVVQESMFTFDLKKCTKSGSMVTCEFTITNNDNMDKKLGIEWVENARVFDDKGNQGKMDAWTIGNASGWGAKAVLIPDLPVNARIRFTNVGTQATILKRIELGLITQYSEGGNYATRDFVVRFADIGIQ